MNTEKIRISLKKIRDFILCCRKTLVEVEDIIEDFHAIKNICIIYGKPTKKHIQLESHFR